MIPYNNVCVYTIGEVARNESENPPAASFDSNNFQRMWIKPFVMSQRVPASSHRLVIHVDSPSIYVAVNKIETRELSISNYMRQLHWKLGWNNFYFLLLYSLFSFVKNEPLQK